MKDLSKKKKHKKENNFKKESETLNRNNGDRES